jgi:thiamine pyrophosphate-dependent acetolactate synthase large subunit-like protein
VVPALGELAGLDDDPVASLPAPGALCAALGLRAAPPPGGDLLRPLRGPALILAGPGVLAAGAVDGLRAFAAAAHLGVLNTFGAKGVFRWDDPHHLGTAGLQAEDFRLAGLAEAATVVATGLDDAEVPPSRWRLGAQVVTLAPGALGALAPCVARSPHPIRRPPLYERIAAVAQPGYRSEARPRHPARAVADLKADLPPGGLLAAQPGPAGLWVARTFPTDRPGQVVVPPTAAPGVAAACGLAAARRAVPAVVVTTAPPDPVTVDIAARAAAERLALRLVCWDGDVDLGRTAELIAAAGPVVAWGTGG